MGDNTNAEKEEPKLENPKPEEAEVPSVDSKTLYKIDNIVRRNYQL